MSCKPGSTESACELQALAAHKLLESCTRATPNSSRATAKQLPRPPRLQSARKRASLANSFGSTKHSQNT